MKTALAIGSSLLVMAPAMAANRVNVSAKDLTTAINAADSRSVPYRRGNLHAEDVRRVRCLGPDEEPTEFRCVWRQRTAHGWRERQTWLTKDSWGWKVVD